MSVDRAVFPEDFWWGTATAAYQIEGAAAEGGRGLSIWDTFSHTPGKTHNGDTGDTAVDHYHRVGSDVKLMTALGTNAYRFSISWSRLLPEGTGRINETGVAFYRDLCERLVEAGIAPMATLYHWDLPQALQDRGGWLDADSPNWFAEYATVAKERLGDLITTWATLNEPWCSAFLGHSAGVHAPGGADPGEGFIAAHHLVVAHHRAIAAMRATAHRREDLLGIVLNLIPAWPASASSADAAAADAADAVQNRLFADAAFHGRYPDEVLSCHARYGVDARIDLADLAEARTDLDYLGVNYYNINRFEHVPGEAAPRPWPAAEEARLADPPGTLTEMGWGVEPAGLLWMLERVVREYPAVPIYICENGAAYVDVPNDKGEVIDPERIEYFTGHLAAVAQAIERGVDVRGYFAWSLLDNFEWAFGYDKRFGLVYVDRDSMERTVKASGRWYRDFIAGK